MKLPKGMKLMLANGRILDIEFKEVKEISPLIVEAKIEMSKKFLRSELVDCVEIRY